MAVDQSDTHHKALAVNLDPKIYGTIAEIGAGQEVARWFFQVGGAAGTIAKTISAYDMLVSDELYGKGTRYVSRDRVESMITCEFTAIVERLGQTRGEKSSFFAFADTVSARNYAGTNECHGWLGIRFQLEPNGSLNDIFLHVNMRDNSNRLQQEALGILGVNLIHAVFFRRENAEEFLRALVEGIGPDRIEIDTVFCVGPKLKQVNLHDVGSKLIELGLSEAVLFEKNGAVAPPTEVFHNRPLVLLRTDFERVQPERHAKLLREGIDHVKLELSDGAKEPVSLLEISVRTGDDAHCSDAVRQKVAAALEHSDRVLLTCYRENFLLTRYLRRYAPVEPIRFVIGSSSLVMLFEKSYYESVPGRVLEGLGRLFANNVKVLVKPMPHAEFRRVVAGAAHPPTIHGSGNVGLESISFDPPLNHLFEYLRSINALVSLNTE